MGRTVRRESTFDRAKRGKGLLARVPKKRKKKKKSLLSIMKNRFVKRRKPIKGRSTKTGKRVKLKF